MRRSSNLLLTVVAFALLAGAGCTKQARMSRHMQKADRYFAQGDYDRADAEYINALRLDPQAHSANAARAYARVGIIALEQGRLSRAYRPLAKAVELETNNIEYHNKLGLFYLAAGASKEARNEANFVLSHQPQDPDAPLLLADACGTTKESDEARQRLQKLSVPSNKRAAIDVALGNIALRERDMKTAAAAYESARATDPKFGPLHSSLALFYWAQQDTKRADEEFKAATAASPVRSQIRLRYAQFKLQAGDAAGAKAMLEEISGKAPDFSPAFIALAALSANSKKYDDASGYLEKVLARDPENYEALVLSGSYAMSQGNAARAAGQFEKLCQYFPKVPMAAYQLAAAENALNDTPKAIAHLNQALALNTNFAEATLLLDQIKIKRGEFSSQVIASLRQLARQHPQLISAQLLLGEAYQGHGDVEEAARLYHHMESAYPTNADVPLLLGRLLARQHRNAEARQEFNKALALAPDSLVALESVTGMDLVERNYSAALQRVRTFAEKKPGAPEPGLLIAKVYLAQQDVKQATAILNQAISAHPDFVPAYLLLANAYNEAKDTANALDITRKLLAKYPDQPGGQMLLATLSDEMKDYKTSEDAYEKVLAQNPQNSIALNNLACIYAEHGELERGYELARKARELMPRDPATADTLGWICYERGDYEQAAALLQDSVGTLSSVPEIQLHLGMTRYMLGDEARARASLQYAAQSKNNFAGKELAARSLTILAVDPKSAGPDARAMLEKRVSEQPGDAIAQLRLAAIYQRDGKRDKAEACYEALLKQNPRNVRGLVELARIDAAQNSDSDHAKALELAKNAHKLAPDDLDVSRVLGRVSYLTGDDRRAYDLLKEGAARTPGDADLQFDFAEAAYVEGRLDEARFATRSALQVPGFARAADAKQFLEIASVAQNPSSAAAASAQVNQALKLDPADVPALLALGLAQESKKDSTAARQSYEKALSRHPDFLFAKRRLAILLAQSGGDDKRAYDFANQARAMFPDDAELSKALGILTYRQADYSRSSKYLKEGITKSPDAQSLFYLGMAQYKLRERADSKKNLLQAVNLNLPDNLAGEAKKVLAELN